MSTGDQTTENQLRRLRSVADGAGWAVVQVYDETASAVGARAAYYDMLRDAQRVDSHSDIAAKQAEPPETDHQDGLPRLVWRGSGLSEFPPRPLFPEWKSMKAEDGRHSTRIARLRAPPLA